MSKETHSIDVSAETRERLQDLREQGESLNETVERVVENNRDERVLYSKFSVVAVAGAVLWLLSYAVFGQTVSNAFAGVFIALTLFWLGYRELAFRGIIVSSDEYGT